ncbi:hypothetical protein AB0C61_36855 [Streptomyces sp. NPDC048680]|uniref:hypothetical protein n=1 Tax=Streptomyces sp. NPDC048680 TaxID=3155492 RepID=UPI00343E8718
MVRSDRRVRRTVFFQDADNHDRWHVLRWTGLPPAGEIPAFSDRSVDDLLGEVRRRKLAPRSDAELLPVLLDLLGEVIPVKAWPTQQTKRQRAARSRQVVQGDAAAADQAGPANQPGLDEGSGAWPEQARTLTAGADADRHHRREALADRRPTPPPRLGDSLRRRSLFLLPPDDDVDGTPEREKACPRSLGPMSWLGC